MERHMGIIRSTAAAAALVVVGGGLAYGFSQLRAAERPHAVASTTRVAATPSPSGVTAPSAIPSSGATAAPASALPVVATLPFKCASRAGGSASASDLRAVRIAHQAGYDRIVFEFNGSLPSYALTPQSTSQFIRDASGQAVTLKGSAGLRVVFQNASSDPTYTGNADLRPTLPIVAEVARIGDFERVLNWGVGLNQSACSRVLELSNPARLVIDVQTPEAAG